MRLGIDIGCGTYRVSMPDTKFLYVDVDTAVKPDVVCHAMLLPFRYKTFDIVHSSHVLEHFPYRLWKAVLLEWLRMVKQDGQIWFRLPNILWAVNRIYEDKVIDQHVLNVLWGGQDGEFNFHYNGLTPQTMQLALSDFGFEIFHYEEFNYNMTIGARRTCV